MARTRCSVRTVCLGILVASGAACGADEQAEPPHSRDEPEGRQPPAPGPTHPGDGPGVVLAVSRLFLGDTNPDGTADPTRAWRQYGYDLDRVAGDEEAVCRRPGPSSPHPEGLDGIDNSFGERLLPLLLASAPHYSARVDEALAAGAPTLLLRIDALGPERAYRPLPSRIYRAAAVTTPPAWDGSDLRPIAPESLVRRDDLDSARVFFPGAYLVDDTWVSPPGATIELFVPLVETTLRLAIRDAVVTAEIDGDRQGARRGIIAGVLDREETVIEAVRVLGTLDPRLCSATLAEHLRAHVRGSADVLVGGSRDPDAECDGISIGLGFEARAVRLGRAADPTPPEPDVCGPGAP